MVILYSMKRPIFVRPISDAERKTLEAGLRSPDAFTLRRCQILLASSRGKNAYQIAHELGCNPQTARNAIHAFNEKGLPEALQPGSKHPHTVHRAFDDEQAEALRELLHQDPRKFGKDSSLWTLAMAALVSFEEGLTKERITGETVRATLARLGVRWERAKRWITSPDPEYARKKASFASDRLISLAEGRPEWVAGFLDESWFSRLARPAMGSWSDAGEPLRLIEQSVAKDDPSEATKAISYYGLYVPELEKVWLRFADGRPVSSITTRFLSWCCQKLQAVDKRVWVLIWDNASWHISKELQEWIASHNHKVKNSGDGVRIINCLLPKKSPWLNSMEPKWVLMASARS
jgi:transposase